MEVFPTGAAARGEGARHSLDTCPGWCLSSSGGNCRSRHRALKHSCDTPALSTKGSILLRLENACAGTWARLTASPGSRRLEFPNRPVLLSLSLCPPPGSSFLGSGLSGVCSAPRLPSCWLSVLGARVPPPSAHPLLGPASPLFDASTFPFYWSAPVIPPLVLPATPRPLSFSALLLARPPGPPLSRDFVSRHDAAGPSGPSGTPRLQLPPQTPAPPQHGPSTRRDPPQPLGALPGTPYPVRPRPTDDRPAGAPRRHPHSSRACFRFRSRRPPRAHSRFCACARQLRPAHHGRRANGRRRTLEPPRAPAPLALRPRPASGGVAGRAAPSRGRHRRCGGGWLREPGPWTAAACILGPPGSSDCNPAKGRGGLQSPSLGYSTGPGPRRQSDAPELYSL